MEYEIQRHDQYLTVRFSGELDSTRECDGTWLAVGRELREERRPDETLYIDLRSLDRVSTRALHDLETLIGLVQGGVQALSRSLYSRLIPPDEAAEFFGFYNMLGKLAAIIGPTLMGWVSLQTGNPRLSILSIAVLFIAGGALLIGVREPKVARSGEGG